MEWKQLLYWNVLSLFWSLPCYRCPFTSQVPAPLSVACPVQALPQHALLCHYSFPVRSLSICATSRPMESGDHVTFFKTHISPWNVLLHSWALRLLSVLTIKNLHSDTHPKSGLCIFRHCHSHSRIFSWSVIHLCEVTWSTSGNGKGKVRAQWAWLVRFALRTWLSLFLSQPYSLQWSTAGTLNFYSEENCF